MRLAGRGGERAIALADFFALPEDGRRTETRLAEDELVLGIEMPSHPDETRSIYLKAMDRAAFSFALVGVAAVLRVSNSGKIGTRASCSAASRRFHGARRPPKQCS